MAPPLLPVTRLVVCAACSEHVKVSDDRCPHCGVTLPGRAGLLARAAGVALAGVMLIGCEAHAVYGVPTTSETLDTDPSTGSTGNTTGDGTATADSSSTAVPTSTGSESSGTTTADTTTGGSESSGDGSGSSGESSGESSGSGSTTMAPETSGEPEYGVPSTTTGPEPDYGVPGTT